MRNDAFNLRVQKYALEKELNDLQGQIAQVDKQIAQIENACGRRPEGHRWGEVVYAPIRHQAYHLHGDPTMGIPPIDVPARVKDQWTQGCLDCGYERKTTKSECIPTKRPVF